MALKKVLRSIAFISPTTTKLALVVRADLKMSKGKTAAQTAHAAVLCYSAAQQSEAKKLVTESWYETGQPKIVLRVDNYDDIISLAEKAKENGVMTALVKDAGKTQLEPGTATVLGIGPDNADLVDKIVAHLKLL